MQTHRTLLIEQVRIFSRTESQGQGPTFTIKEDSKSCPVLRP